MHKEDKMFKHPYQDLVSHLSSKSHKGFLSQEIWDLLQFLQVERRKEKMTRSAFVPNLK